jgi:hypothetical protein
MPVTPAGDPLWAHTSDHTTYGGDLEKQNYQSQGAINGKTDVDAENFARFVADLEAVGRTAPFASVTYTQDDTGTNDPTVTEYDSQAGSAPTGVRNSDGRTTWSWDASYADPYSKSADVHIAHAMANVHGTTAATATVVPLDPDVNGKNEAVMVRCFDAAGNPVKDKTVTLKVWTSSV